MVAYHVMVKINGYNGNGYIYIQYKKQLAIVIMTNELYKHNVLYVSIILHAICISYEQKSSMLAFFSHAQCQAVPCGSKMFQVMAKASQSTIEMVFCGFKTLKHVWCVWVNDG